MSDLNFEMPNKNVEIKINKTKILVIIIILAVLGFIFTGLYIINPEEVGVIQRFGKFTKITQPGLHFKIPFGVDALTKVKVKHVYKSEFGFRTLQAGIKSRYSSQDFTRESLILTGDLNIADVHWSVQYRIKDPVKFLFNLRDVDSTIRNLSESTVKLIVGDHSVDEVIVLNRKEIAYQAKEYLQKMLDEYGAGIEIVALLLQNVNPPKPVQPAFNAVNAAKQEKEKIINNADKQRNEIIPKAKGKAKQAIQEAQGYAINRVNTAKGDVTRFKQIYAQYKNAKNVTRKRLYLETMSEILPKIEKVYIVDEKQKGILPLLNLDKGGK